MPSKSKDVWDQVLGYLKEKINPQSFQTWLRPTRLKGISGSKLSIQVPNREFQDWIQQSYGPAVREALQALKLPYPEVEFVYDDSWERIQKQTAVQGPAVLLRASEIKPKPVHWLWADRIPSRKLTLFAGDPDMGKTAVAIDLAARVTTGSAWPDGGSTRKPGDVLILSAEDDPDDTLVPRLMAAGADLERVHFLVARKSIRGASGTDEVEITLADIEAIKDALVQRNQVKLVIVDPLHGYLGHFNSNKNAEMRAVLKPLADLARSRDISIVLIDHLNKKMDLKAIYRSVGSIAIIAISRAAWFFDRDPENRERRLMLRLKGNLGKDAGGLAYELGSSSVVIRNRPSPVVKVQWQNGAVHLTPDSALQTGARSERTSVLQTAKDFLLETLKDGPVKHDDILAAANAEGIGGHFKRTLYEAKGQLKIRSRKKRDRVRKKDEWWWVLPGQDCKP